MSNIWTRLGAVSAMYQMQFALRSSSFVPIHLRSSSTCVCICMFAAVNLPPQGIGFDSIYLRSKASLSYQHKI